MQQLLFSVIWSDIEKSDQRNPLLCKLLIIFDLRYFLIFERNQTQKLVAQNSCNFSEMYSTKIRIESTISTTSFFLTKDYLKQKYTSERLSARQIAVLNNCSHSVINAALKRHCIESEARASGWTPYGSKMEGGVRILHVRQQKIIKLIVKKRLLNWSYHKIAEWLKEQGVKSPSGQTKWYHTTVKRIYALELSHTK